MAQTLTQNGGGLFRTNGITADNGQQKTIDIKILLEMAFYKVYEIKENQNTLSPEDNLYADICKFVSENKLE